MFSYLIAVCSKNCSYPLSFPFHASNSPLQPAEEKGNDGAAHGLQEHMVSVGTWNWRIPFLKHKPSLGPNGRHEGLR